jgi:hypothetical protein
MEEHRGPRPRSCPPDRIDPGRAMERERERGERELVSWRDLGRGRGQGFGRRGKPEGSRPNRGGSIRWGRTTAATETQKQAGAPSPPPALDFTPALGPPIPTVEILCPVTFRLCPARVPPPPAALLLSRFGWAACRGQLLVRFIFHTRTSGHKARRLTPRCSTPCSSTRTSAVRRRQAGGAEEAAPAAAL